MSIISNIRTVEKSEVPHQNKQRQNKKLSHWYSKQISVVLPDFLKKLLKAYGLKNKSKKGGIKFRKCKYIGLQHT